LNTTTKDDIYDEIEKNYYGPNNIERFKNFTRFTYKDYVYERINKLKKNLKIGFIKKLRKEVLNQTSYEDIKKEIGWPTWLYFIKYKTPEFIKKLYAARNPYNIEVINNTYFKRINISYQEGFPEPPDIITNSTALTNRFSIYDWLNERNWNWRDNLSLISTYLKNFGDISSPYIYGLSSIGLIFGGIPAFYSRNILRFFLQYRYFTNLLFEGFNSNLNFDTFQSLTVPFLLGDLALRGRISDFIFNNFFRNLNANFVRNFFVHDRDIMDNIIQVPTQLNFFESLIRRRILNMPNLLPREQRYYLPDEVRYLLTGNIRLNFNNMQQFMFNHLLPVIGGRMSRLSVNLLNRFPGNRIFSFGNNDIYNILFNIYQNRDINRLDEYIREVLLQNNFFMRRFRLNFPDLINQRFHLNRVPNYEHMFLSFVSHGNINYLFDFYPIFSSIIRNGVRRLIRHRPFLNP